MSENSGVELYMSLSTRNTIALRLSQWKVKWNGCSDCLSVHVLLLLNLQQLDSISPSTGLSAEQLCSVWKETVKWNQVVVSLKAEAHVQTDNHYNQKDVTTQTDQHRPYLKKNTRSEPRCSRRVSSSCLL
jgi:AhpD family alkylhydroperoxidase